VAAVVLARLGAEVDFFCALGDDANGAAAAGELAEAGVTVHAAVRQQPTRRVITLLEPAGERTIMTIGERLQPAGADRLQWNRLDAADGAYFTAGDATVAVLARRAPVLVCSPRARDGLEGNTVACDALVYSCSDRDELEWARRLRSRARLMVETEGPRGGHWEGESEGRWSAAEPSGRRQDDYGCGDAFAAGLTFGLSSGRSVQEAADIGARCAAEMLTIVGAP
jgi:ribokinase